MPKIKDDIAAAMIRKRLRDACERAKAIRVEPEEMVLRAYRFGHFLAAVELMTVPEILLLAEALAK